MAFPTFLVVFGLMLRFPKLPKSGKAYLKLGFSPFFLKSLTMSLVQYVVIRKDLSWPVGALIAQGIHANTAALVISKDCLETRQYLENLENLTTCVLGIDNEEKLKQLVTRLQSGQIQHHLWIEQPENMAVSLATAPGLKSHLAPYFKGLKLLRSYVFFYRLHMLEETSHAPLIREPSVVKVFLFVITAILTVSLVTLVIILTIKRILEVFTKQLKRREYEDRFYSPIISA